ncbi:MAG: hypothetical protein OEN02_00605, partial [Gammaproteobacteria bacterium]|nr:hypothetical protein [Gammaproteobacteria bacterium]
MIGIVSLLLLFVSPVKAGEICESRLDSLEFEDFKAWIQTVRESNCARTTLSEYPELARVDVGDDPVAATSAYQAAVRVFLSVIGKGSFDPDFIQITKTMNLQSHADAVNFKALTFNLKEPEGTGYPDIERTIDIGNTAVTTYKTYRRYCVTAKDETACALWEKTARLLGAMAYITEDYRGVIIGYTLTQFQRKLDDTIDKWDDYFEQRKPQLPWEMAIN